MTSLNSVQANYFHEAKGAILPELWADIFPQDMLAELSAHPFLVACSSGNSNHDLLRNFLIQHQYYSQYFTRYLCAMMASLPSQSDVKALAENLFEEMGFDHSTIETHAELYLKTMTAAGAKPGSRPMHGATRNLIDAMFRYCRSPDPLDGLAALCLGAEAIVPIIYEPVLTGLRNTNIPAEGLKFFEIHVAEDEAHAIVMRNIIDKLLEIHPYRRKKVLAIGEDMIQLRIAMLSGVYEPSLEAA
jgi:pyrroloquinoline quinone (PQQ) biosynthesis protein C